MPPFRTLRTAFALALLALVSRALVPMGFMPTTAPNGGFTFAMCSEGLAATGWLDADGTIHKQGDDPRDGENEDCAFSGVAAATLASVSPAPLPAVPTVVDAAYSMLSSPGRGLAAPPPPATGPPALI